MVSYTECWQLGILEQLAVTTFGDVVEAELAGVEEKN